MVATVDSQVIDELFASFDRTDAPGFAVGIALNGRPVYRRGFGMASIELPTALSPTIRMRIGSVTKHFTALAVMLLAEEGRLSVDASPRRYLPELPDWAEAMTLRQLMAHTSGVRDSLDLLLHTSGMRVTAAPDFQPTYLAGLDSVNFTAGTSWNYSNGGYVLLTEIVSRVAGRPFGDVLRERIFEPVGMVDTLLRPLDTDLVPNSATLHLPNPAGGYERGTLGTPIGGEGGIVSTADDMLRWLRHMRDPLVGTSETWAQMRRPRAANGYGLGLIMKRHRGLDTVGHAGAVVGGSSQMVKVLGPDLDIVLMSNGISSVEGYRLIDAIIDRCVPGLPPEPEPVGGQPLTGTYYSAHSGRVLVLGDQGGRQVVTTGAITLPALSDGQGGWMLPILPTDLRLTPSDDGATLQVREFGAADQLQRVMFPGAAVPVGRYENQAARAAATISIGAGGSPGMTMTGPLGSLPYALDPVAPDVWTARAANSLPLVATLEFDGTGFRLSSGRTVRLPFASVA